ncbi:MAG: hypothetical protein GY805_04915 [Chloroflexi bacterium]|nr:hypothetical protein [Chloroflexota bacterium]
MRKHPHQWIWENCKSEIVWKTAVSLPSPQPHSNQQQNCHQRPNSEQISGAVGWLLASKPQQAVVGGGDSEFAIRHCFGEDTGSRGGWLIL